MTTTATIPDPRDAARDLIIQAASILEPFRDEDGEEDHRVGLLHAISETWGQQLRARFVAIDRAAAAEALERRP